MPRFLQNLLFIFLFSTLLASGCTTPPQAVPFESVMKGVWSDWKNIANVTIPADKADVEVLSALVPSRQLDELEVPLTQIDLSTYALIAVFQGYQGFGGFEVEVQHIQRLGKQVKIYARFISPAPNDFVTLATTSPYHVVRVKRADLPPAGEVTFVLIDETSGKEVARESYSLR